MPRDCSKFRGFGGFLGFVGLRAWALGFKLLLEAQGFGDH